MSRQIKWWEWPSMNVRSDMGVGLVDFMGGDAAVVRSARTSTLGAADADGEESAGLIRFLMRNNHATPFESSVFTFRVEAPIFVTRQMMRHRIASWNEESGRYRQLDSVFYVPDPDRPLVQVGKTGDYQFVEADDFRIDKVREEIHSASVLAMDTYERLLKLGIAKEVARMVLPVNTYSSLYMTVNARSLMNFLNLRLDSHAQYEIREVAAKMAVAFEAKMPLTYNAWRETHNVD